MTLFILTTCCLTAILIFALLWRRESRRLADADAREREATARLSAAEARLAAAEQAASAEKEFRLRYEEQVRSLTEQRSRTEAELAALRAASEAEIAALRQRNAEEREAERTEREKTEERFPGASGTWRRRFWASRLSISNRPARSRSTSCLNRSKTTSSISANGSRRSTPRRPRSAAS